MVLIKLEKLLPKSIRQAGLTAKVSAALLTERYSQVVQEIFGQKIINKVRPLYVRNGTLTVACLNSVISQELKFKENEILKRIHGNTQEKIIARIRYIL